MTKSRSSTRWPGLCSFERATGYAQTRGLPQLSPGAGWVRHSRVCQVDLAGAAAAAEQAQSPAWVACVCTPKAGYVRPLCKGGADQRLRHVPPLLCRGQARLCMRTVAVCAMGLGSVNTARARVHMRFPLMIRIHVRAVPHREIKGLHACPCRQMPVRDDFICCATLQASAAAGCWRGLGGRWLQAGLARRPYMHGTHAWPLLCRKPKYSDRSVHFPY